MGIWAALTRGNPGAMRHLRFSFEWGYKIVVIPWYLDTETGWSLWPLTSITTIKLQWACTTRFEAPCQVQILILMMVSYLLSDISCPKPWWILQSLAMAVEPNAAACHHPNVWRCWTPKSRSSCSRARLGAVPSNHNDGWPSSLMSTPE